MTALAYYCTYFDERYLTRGVALHASLRRHCTPFRLFVLCMSDACYSQLSALALPDVVPLRIETLEAGDPALAAVKQNRSAIEYYFTCTPALMVWLLDTQPDIDLLTYLDADLFFFARPDVLFEGMIGASTLIVPHRFSARNAAMAQWGIFNVGWVSFHRDADGLACLRWWRDACIDWCRDVLEGDRFADQKYLDQFATRFKGVRIDNHPGVNLAPWNLDNYRLTAGKDGTPHVDGQPVIFFHFHRLRRVSPWLWQTPHPDYGAPLDRTVRRLLYAPYLADLDAAERQTQCARAPVLRRDAAAMGAWQERLRAIAAVLWRGGGLWMAGDRLL